MSSTPVSVSSAWDISIHPNARKSARLMPRNLTLTIRGKNRAAFGQVKYQQISAFIIRGGYWPLRPRNNTSNFISDKQVRLE
jgi:hypothetical protein